MIRHVLFDMDGVLIDSGESIIETNRYVLKQFGMEVPEELLRKVVGPPLTVVYRDYFHFRDEDIPCAIRLYRQKYDDENVSMVTVYDGVTDMLKKLSSDYNLHVATAREERVAVGLLSKLGIKKYFSDINGLDQSEGVRDKSDIIRNIIAKFPGYPPSDFVMIGDREDDIKAAVNNGIRALGAVYGYGSIEEFEDAEYVVSSPADIYNYLLMIGK